MSQKGQSDSRVIYPTLFVASTTNGWPGFQSQLVNIRDSLREMFSFVAMTRHGLRWTEAGVGPMMKGYIYIFFLYVWVLDAKRLSWRYMWNQFISVTGSSKQSLTTRLSGESLFRHFLLNASMHMSPYIIHSTLKYVCAVKTCSGCDLMPKP